jgi:hypothetical protein
MVGQVKVVSILMIIHGVMLILMGLYLTVAGPLLFTIVKLDDKAPPSDDKVFSVLMVVLVVLGVLVLLVGALNLVAGIRCMRFRGRGLALTAVIANVIPLLTFYCAPTSIALSVYALIVLLNGDVVKAFAMGSQGVPPDEIKRAFRKGAYESSEEDYDDRRRGG